MIDQGDSADGEAMKLGEFPPFSAPISSKIQKLLSETDLELYRKGVRAEAQGLGIGAATYFRRIVVEEQWQRLVTEIRQAAAQLGVEDIELYDANRINFGRGMVSSAYFGENGHLFRRQSGHPSERSDAGWVRMG